MQERKNRQYKRSSVWHVATWSICFIGLADVNMRQKQIIFLAHIIPHLASKECKPILCQIYRCLIIMVVWITWVQQGMWPMTILLIGMVREMRARKRRECGLDEQRWKKSSIYSWSEEEGTTHYTMQRMLMIRMAQRSRGMGTAVHPTPTPPLVQNWHNCPLCTTLPAPWPRPWTLIVNNCLSVRDTADSHCTTNRKIHWKLNRLTIERINKNK